MQEANRFAPPGTTVADVGSDAVQPVKFWPPNGRIGRLRFLAYGLALYVIVIAASAVFGFVAAFARGSVLLPIVAIVGVVAYLVAAATLIVQRSHDMNLSGWWSIAAIVPLVGLLWVLKGGTRGVNRWGPPPPPNGLAVTIFGWLMPVVFAIAFAAAFVPLAFEGVSPPAGAPSR